MNLYGFVTNSPINDRDEYGHEGIGAVAGGALGAIFGGITGIGGGTQGVIAGAVGGALGGALAGLGLPPGLAGAIGAGVQQALLEIFNAKCHLSVGMVVRILVAGAIGGLVGAGYAQAGGIAERVGAVTTNALINLFSNIAVDNGWSNFQPGNCGG